MRLGIRKTFKILAPGNSLRKRVAYSLTIARAILVPVIFLAIYYLFEMGWIVDRIVNVDAPAATLAQRASIEVLEARRAERNYLLLHDPIYLAANRESLGRTRQIVSQIQDLDPQDLGETQRALEALGVYEQRFGAAVSATSQPGQGDADRIQTVVRAYEKDLNDLLRGAKLKKREQLIEELRNRVGSFDAQISQTVQEGNPALGAVTADLQTSSQEVLRLLSAAGIGKLEARGERSQGSAAADALRGMGAEHRVRNYVCIQRVGEFYFAAASGETADQLARGGRSRSARRRRNRAGNRRTRGSGGPGAQRTPLNCSIATACLTRLIRFVAAKLLFARCLFGRCR